MALAGGGGSEALPVGLFLAVLKTASGIGNLLFASAVAAQDWACRLIALLLLSRPGYLAASHPDPQRAGDRAARTHRIA